MKYFDKTRRNEQFITSIKTVESNAIHAVFVLFWGDKTAALACPIRSGGITRQ